MTEGKPNEPLRKQKKQNRYRRGTSYVTYARTGTTYEYGQSGNTFSKPSISKDPMLPFSFGGFRKGVNWSFSPYLEMYRI